MIPEEIVEDIDVAVKEIMKIEKIEHYKYEIEGTTECGDNYMGEVIFLRIVPDEGSKEPYYLVVKTAKRSEELREKLPIQLFYTRELFMYSDVFPKFRQFLEEVNPAFKFEFVPEIYWINNANGKETVVQKNLKTEGFKVHDRKKPWNLQHSLFTMKVYGKLHALSMALKDKKPELYDEMSKNLGTISEGFNEKFDVKKFYDQGFRHVLDLLRKMGREDLAEKYLVLLDELEDLFNYRTEEKDKVAICHMDCWNNNFMFKYEDEDESTPSDIRVLDFQLSLIDSPAKDLSYNIYTTCDNTCLAHFDELLQTYHESLRQSLESLGCDPQNFLSIEELRRHWRKYGTYGIFLAMNLIKMQLVDKDDAPLMEDMLKDENMVEGLDVKLADPKEYDRRIMEVFLHFGDNFL